MNFGFKTPDGEPVPFQGGEVEIVTTDDWHDLAVRWREHAERYMAERDAAATRAAVAERRIDAVLALHRMEPTEVQGGWDEPLIETVMICRECGYCGVDDEGPVCPTVRAIEGDDATP